jgi:hypothetical protein
VRTAAYKFKIRPEHLCVDRTGNGAGVHDLLRNRWNLAVMGINYTEGATEMKIMAEDLYPPVKEYERICTELWFAMQKWAEFGYLMIHPTVDHHVLAEQLIKRLYKTTGKKTRVESKRDYISRNHPSPDEADSLSLMLHGVRVSFGVILSMTGSSEYDPDPDGDDEMVYRIDETNRFQSLEVL